MDDTTFFKELLDHLESNYCIDLENVHLTGCSAGAIYTYDLAKKFSDRIASIAP